MTTSQIARHHVGRRQIVVQTKGNLGKLNNFRLLIELIPDQFVVLDLVINEIKMCQQANRTDKINGNQIEFVLHNVQFVSQENIDDSAELEYVNIEDHLESRIKESNFTLNESEKTQRNRKTYRLQTDQIQN